jgi:hypothetical protein
VGRQLFYSYSKKTYSSIARKIFYFSDMSEKKECLGGPIFGPPSLSSLITGAVRPTKIVAISGFKY